MNKKGGGDLKGGDAGREAHVKLEAEIGVLLPQAKECQEPPWGERGKKLDYQKERGFPDTSVLDFWLPEL